MIMIYKEYAPGEKLAPFVKCFWRLEHDYSKPPMQNGEHLWPDGFYELLFTYGHPYGLKNADGTSTQLPQDFLIGLYDRALRLDSPGVTGLYGIRFFAWGIYPALKRSMTYFNNTIFSFKEVFGERIVQPKCGSKNQETAITELEKFALRVIDNKTENIDIIRQFGQSIEEAGGNVRIADTVQRLHQSPRKIQRIFLEYTGISAKHYAKIVRFREAKRSIEKNPNINMAELTYSSGYSDQPHFIRNFKQLYGITPSSHRKRVLELMSTKA